MSAQAQASNGPFPGEPMNRKRILLADDHVEMLDQVRTLLGEDYEVVGTAENGQELVEAARTLKPDLIVSDISMPVMTGFEAIARLRQLGLTTRVIFLTVQSSTAYVKKARALGAEGYVLKVYTTEQLPLAVSSVLTGTPYISPQLQLSHQLDCHPERALFAKRRIWASRAKRRCATQQSRVRLASLADPPPELSVTSVYSPENQPTKN